MLKSRPVSWFFIVILLVVSLLAVACEKTENPTQNTTSTSTTASAAAVTPSPSLQPSKSAGVTPASTTTAAVAAPTTSISSTVPTLNFDSTPPSVSATTPIGNASGVELTTTLVAVFSEEIDTATINANSVSLMSGTTRVEGSAVYDETTRSVTFTPAVALASSTLYKAVIENSVADKSGNKLASTFSWTFTTASNDNLAPTITSNSPAHNSSNVALSTFIDAVFSENMDSATINTSTITLKKGSTPVTGSVVYYPDKNSVQFDPSAALSSGTTYTAVISGSVADLAGNKLGSDYIWSFTTASSSSGGGGGGGGSGSSDKTAPAVVEVTPEDGLKNVEVNAPITATFSETMKSSTLKTNFILTLDGTAVNGSVSYSGKVATFTPEYSLEYGSVYTATVQTGAADSAGNALEEEYSWTFTTGVSTQSVTLSVNSPDEVTAGSTFDVLIDISAVENLIAYQFDLSFDTSVIELVAVDDDILADGLVGSTVMENTGLDKSGKVRVLGKAKNEDVADGSGYLVVIHFKAIGSIGQNSALKFLQIFASGRYADYLYDSNAVPIECATINGTVKIIE